MKAKIRKFLAVMCLVALPIIGFAQAHCYVLVGSVSIIGGNEMHIEYWCCTGPEGCFWDIYML
jgi:hypothetical protein